MEKALDMRQIKKVFGSGHTEITALKGIDFSVAPGEFVSIIGPSGFILQSSNLIPYLKIQEQFFLVDKVKKEALNKERIEKLLTSLDILDLKDKYPRDLSGGERQRVAIGRALYNDPSLILADEPTASLDTDHAYDVVKLLAKETHENQKATIMVTHDPRMTQWSDRIFRMEDGLLVPEEAPQENEAK